MTPLIKTESPMRSCSTMLSVSGTITFFVLDIRSLLMSFTQCDRKCLSSKILSSYKSVTELLLYALPHDTVYLRIRENWQYGRDTLRCAHPVLYTFHRIPGVLYRDG